MASAGRLIEAVPSRLRFSSAAGGAGARSLLLRNISVGELPLKVDCPGQPFKIVHGGERLAGEVVRLQPGETIALRVALDRGSMPAGESMLCKFLVVRIDMCLPFSVEFVVAPDDMSKEDVQRFVQRSLPPELARPSFAATALAKPVGQLANSPSHDNDAGGEQAPAEGAAAVPARFDDDRALSMLAAFLGEAPAAAAVRPTRAATTLHGAQVSHHGRGDGDEESEPDETLAEPPDSQRLSLGLDDDRPPTPEPEGFQCPPRAVPVARRKTPPTASPDSPCGGRSSPPAAGGIARAEFSGAPPAMPSAAARAPAVPPATSAVAARATSIPGPPAALAAFLGAPPSDAALRHAPAAVAEFLGAPPSDAALRHAPARASVPSPPPGAAADGLFYIEGVGWCDEYGNVVDCGGGALAATTGGVARRSGRPPGGPPADLAATAPGARLVPRAAPGATCTRPRKPGGLEGGGRGPSPQPPKRLTQKDLDANWAALGGI